MNLSSVPSEAELTTLTEQLWGDTGEMADGFRETQMYNTKTIITSSLVYHYYY